MEKKNIYLGRYLHKIKLDITFVSNVSRIVTGHLKNSNKTLKMFYGTRLVKHSCIMK